MPSPTHTATLPSLPGADAARELGMWIVGLVLVFEREIEEPQTVAARGDVNGDGYADLLVGAPHWDFESSPPDLGRVFGFYGSPGGLLTLANLSVDGRNSGAFGGAVSFAGDCNGDGYDEVLIGAPQLAGGGAAYLHSGADYGLSPFSSVELFTPGATAFGSAVLGAGDVNGDGYDDAVVGATGEAGAIYVYFSSGAGLGSAPSQTFTGAATGDRVGFALAAGDFDADGYGDVVAGVPAATAGSAGTWVLRGSATGLTGPDALTGPDTMDLAVGDFNGDGYADLAEYDGTEATVWVRLGGAAGLVAGTETLLYDREAVYADDTFASYIASAGDTNGDGYDELLVSDFGFDAEGGVVHVHMGGPAGLDADRVADLIGAAGSRFGYGAAGVGDLNGDGYEDLAVAAPSAYEVHVFYGGSDADADGVRATDDCDDADAAVRGPGERFTDGDGDGFGGAALAAGCLEAGQATVGGDCDDAEGSAFPGASEVPDDGIDQDCDGEDLVTADTGLPAGDSGTAKECGCDGGAGLAAWLWPAALGALLRRRRSARGDSGGV